MITRRPCAWLSALLLSTLLCSSCRSSRQVVTETSEVSRVELVAAVSADSVARHAVTAEASDETRRLAADENGSVEIVRDSVGRPVYVSWRRSCDIAASERVRALLDHCLDEVSVSGSAAGAVVSDSASLRHEDKKTEIKGPVLEAWITVAGLACLALCLLYVFFDDCLRPWIKKRLLR